MHGAAAPCATKGELKTGVELTFREHTSYYGGRALHPRKMKVGPCGAVGQMFYECRAKCLFKRAHFRACLTMSLIGFHE